MEISCKSEYFDVVIDDLIESYLCDGLFKTFFLYLCKKISVKLTIAPQNHDFMKEFPTCHATIVIEQNIVRKKNKNLIKLKRLNCNLLCILLANYKLFVMCD